MKDEALRQALDYIIATNKNSTFWLVPQSELNKTVTAIKQALEQPEPVQQEKDWGAVAEKHLSALKQATKVTTEDAVVRAVHKIMQKEPEPVAHFGSAYVNENGVHITTVLGPVEIPLDAKLYLPPPKREWQGLTDEEIDQGLLRSDYAFKTAEAWRAGVVFAMTKLKEKNK